jgi:endonuclease YncB( thermonuclease family)
MVTMLVLALFSQTITGRVVGVTDGDTVTILANSVQHKIRMQNIDAPETKGQPYGNVAKAALSNKIFGKEVQVQLEGKDHYGRDLGTIKLNERNINLEMVEEGHAWCYRQYCKDRRFFSAEFNAKQEGKGLWQLGFATPPWEFRSEKKEKSKTYSGKKKK